MYNKILIKLLVILTFFKCYSDCLTKIDSLPYEKGAVTSLDWNLPPKNNYLVASGFDDNNKQLTKIYEFENHSLYQKKASISNQDNFVNSVKWLNTDKELYISTAGQEINIYKYNTHRDKLSQTKAEANFNGIVMATDWLNYNNHYYIAAAGKSNCDEDIIVYKFNQNNGGSLVKIASSSFYNGIVKSINWITIRGKNYLAVGGSELNSISQEIRIYEFNPHEKTVKLKSSKGLFSGTAEAVQWLKYKEKNLLIASGFEGKNGQFLRIYNFNEKNDELYLIVEKAINDSYIRQMSAILINKKIYIALGLETKNTHKELQLYQYNNKHNKLELVTKTIAGHGLIRSLDWQKGCNHSNVAYLAVGGDDVNQDALDIYEFKTEERPNHNLLDNFFTIFTGIFKKI